MRSWEIVGTRHSGWEGGVAADRSGGERTRYQHTASGGMESQQAIQVYNPSMAALNRARSALATAQRSELSWLLREFFAELENFCPVQGNILAPERRSPLPVWWPRKPLQDITDVLNIHYEAPADLTEKGKKKKAQAYCWSTGKETTPRGQTRSSSKATASSNNNRGSLLRKGFR
ncbi:hypothetical protein R1sor_010421 [Riccia sorocarpa]|uniref:Uncharacterized protein n=1 Tax=Riccia sorocarpa TaxID=122646 RepID=A0ABD3HXZ9_9MARC